MKALIINSYAGSITLGASACGYEIIASMEDTNFGLDVQKENFPRLNYYEYTRLWPEFDLSDVLVAAHPPCSAFSVQNNSPGTRGTDSNAFACTKRVLDYSMRNNAATIVIESVVGAMAGAWNVHQSYADEHYYDVYRILQNGAMFSAQWRDRFWIVYVRNDLMRGRPLDLRLSPDWETVHMVIKGYEDGPQMGGLDVLLERFKRYLVDIRPCEMTPWAIPLDDDDLAYLFDKREEHHPATGVGNVLWKYKFPERDRTAVIWRYVGTFASGQMCYLHPGKLAGVLLGSSWWYVNGRNLSETGYKRVMGFPADYIFPERKRRAMRTLLSKGVIPAVAEWVLSQVGVNLGAITRGTSRFDRDDDPYEIELLPNKIADFRFKKKHWMTHRRPVIREYEE